VALVCLTASHSVSFEPQTTLLLLAGRRLTGGDRDHVVASCRARLDAYAAARIASSSANVSL
jgi:hypothetical protein